MRYFMKGGEVFREDEDLGYTEHRPRNARRITEAEARAHERKIIAENEAEFEARQERLERAKAEAAAEAAQRRQAVTDALAEAGIPSEVLKLL